jgi:predicted transcriptional regulator
MLIEYDGRNKTVRDDFLDSISEAEKASIVKGLSDAKAGQTVSHSEVKKRYEKWLR